MNIKHNKRRKESVSKIEKVFFDQLRSKELHQIKVSTICNEANINRSTFYAVFTDVYDLAEKIRLRLENEVNNLLEKDFRFVYDKSNFLNLFEHIKENQDLYYFYFRLGYDKTNNLKLYDICNIKNVINTEHLDYHIEFFKNGFNAIIKKWLSDNCIKTPQEMCDILLYEYRIKQ